MLPYGFDSVIHAKKRGGNWEHDKFDEASRKQRPAKPAAEPKPQMTEAERGYKVTVTNTAFSEEEFKVRARIVRLLCS